MTPNQPDSTEWDEVKTVVMVSDRGHTATGDFVLANEPDTIEIQPLGPEPMSLTVRLARIALAVSVFGNLMGMVAFTWWTLS